MWPIIWLALTGAMCLHQFVASHTFQLQLTLAWLQPLTLLIKMSAMVTDYRGHCQPSFAARDYFPVHHVHRNYYK